MIIVEMDSLYFLVFAALCICVTDCRPESSRAPAVDIVKQSRLSRRPIDQMVFPDSQEDERRAEQITLMQMRRSLSPTPATTAGCRDIKIFRHKNGTLVHQYVDCNNSTMNNQAAVTMASRFGEEENKTRPGVPNESNRDSFVFPENDKSSESQLAEPDCANGHRFCTEDSSYPETKIEQLLQRVGNLNDLLQTDLTDADDTILAQRVDVPGEETFCDYDSRIEYPKQGLTRDEKWLPIVNHSNYTQGIRMEMCRNINSPCKMSEIFPYSIKTKCVQKYQYRQLLALVDGQLRREYFSVPTCCICTFTKM